LLNRYEYRGSVIMGGNPIQFDYTVIFLAIFPLGFFALVAYLMVRFLRYLKRRDENEKELIQKMDELIRLQQQSNKTP
jgi:hypothetical protein